MRLAVFLAVLAIACGDDDTSITDASSPDASEPEDAGLEDVAAPDVGTPDVGPEACDMPDEMRVVDCGNCGTRSDRCVEGFWVALSECIGQGECAPAAVETETSEMCGVRQRICRDSCSWTPYEQLEPEGECVPGTEERVEEGCPFGASRTRTCSDACTWDEVVGDCQDDCGTVPESYPPLEDRICIPRGSVEMHEGTTMDSRQFTTLLSAYRIDRYHVTVARLQACIDDGACLADGCSNPTADADHPARCPFARAVTFCEWAGGGIPTLAQWVKAGRGASPRAPAHPWWNGLTGDESNDFYSCDTVPDGRQARLCPDRQARREPVGSAPETQSIWGVESLLGTSAIEWVADVFMDPLSDVYRGSDPVVPATPESRTRVGGNIIDSPTLVTRSEVTRELEQSWFRCAYEVEE